MNVGDDFNRSSSNLGGDVQRLEEGGLSGLHSGVSSRNVDVDLGVGSSLGGGGDLVVEDDTSNVLEISRGEDESDISLDVGKEFLELGEVGEDHSHGSSNHRVLSHEDLSLASEGLSDLMHLVGSNVVDIDDEDRGCRKTNNQPQFSRVPAKSPGECTHDRSRPIA